MTHHSQPLVIVAQQLSFCLPLPRVIGPVEFTEFCALWERIDALLCAGLERDFVQRSLVHKTRKRPMTPGEQATYQLESQRALRCTMARQLLKERFRPFSCRLADSPVLQHFCRLGDLEAVTIPGHSQLHRYASWVPEAEMRGLIARLLQQAQGAEAPSTLGLAQPVDLSTAWVDSTCVETNIHYPVDWVLLRDAVRTLISAILVLRQHGLKQRMPEPTTFMTAMNQWCIKMTHAGKGDKGKARRKAVLREMKQVVQTVREHAERYLALVADLPTPWGWAVAAMRRMQQVLEQLPTIVNQAHDRIIGERQVPNAMKVLSLYEPATAVITRGKAGAQVEFGYTLFVAEQQDGLIVDWALPSTPQSDVALLLEAIPRWKTYYGADCITSAITDRGFDGKASRDALKDAGITNGMCPRSPHKLLDRLREPAFRAEQRRRSQTEGRIGIVKQTFLGGRLHRKGHEHHTQEVAWTILTHNVWVLARLPVASEHALAS